MKALITGGAGFIGSNLARGLIERGDDVRILDNLVTGSLANLHDIERAIDQRIGDVRDPNSARGAVRGVDVVFHLAALPSVARSVRDPASSHEVNAGGTLTMLEAARAEGCRRFVYASSSSVYGDTPILPKHEEMPVSPRSPYAASKLAGEAYCRAYARSYDLETVSLRFFNVFGPRQDPASEYAAVIPRFTTRMLAGERPVVFGDGSQSRDFTHVANAVSACLLAASAPSDASGEAFNVGCGSRTSLLELVELLATILGRATGVDFAEPRPGDVAHSEAAVDRARAFLGYLPVIGVRDGLTDVAEWFARTGAVTV